MQLLSSLASGVSIPALATVFLSLAHVAIAAPVNSTLKVKRQECTYGEQITLEEYENYLKQYYPSTDKYLFYTGNSIDQVRSFQTNNPDYLYYDDFFLSTISQHYDTAFPPDENGCYRLDDGEASSRAIANVVTGNAWVFGGVRYMSFDSFFTRDEIPRIHEGMRSGRVIRIFHMQRNADGLNDILAFENQPGVIVFPNGEADNAS